MPEIIFSKCNRLYYKVRQVLQSMTVITKLDKTLLRKFDTSSKTEIKMLKVESL